MGYSKKAAYERYQKQVKLNIESGILRDSHQLYLERCLGKDISGK